MSIAEYKKALKMGREEYQTCVARGKYPYLNVLEEITSNVDVVSEVPIGIVQAPMKKIVGTNARGRSTAFARNFMPLLEPNTEFALKWATLCQSHLEEGIRDAIKCYEFMNRFYVVEGNKRVSVLKYFDAVSISAEVTRIVPRFRPDDKESRIYYEFLRFYRITEINYIWFSREGSFFRLLSVLGRTEAKDWGHDSKVDFFSSYTHFDKAYAEIGGKALRRITTGDALLKYITVFGYEGLQTKRHAQIVEEVRKLWDEFVLMEKPQPVGLLTTPTETPTKIGFLDRVLGAPDPGRHLKIGFVHDKDKYTSSWTYAHDLGCTHLKEVFGDQIEIVVESKAFQRKESPEEVMEGMIRDGCSVLFTTSPRLGDASIRVAIRHPDVKVLNCAINSASSHMRSYYGRLYEPKFLSGMIAGSMTKNNRIGYIADYPISGMVSSINAFARGARMVNPEAKIYLEWSTVKDVDIDGRMKEYGVDLINNYDMIAPQDASRHFGLCPVDDGGGVKNYSMSIWNWGRFYEKILRSILAGSWKEGENATGGKAVNYWWGLSAGVVDIVYSAALPSDTKRLVEFMRKAIRIGEFDPFGGRILDQEGKERCGDEDYLSIQQIVNMDWLTDNVIGTVPKVWEFPEETHPLLMQEGMTLKAVEAQTLPVREESEE